MAIFPPFITKFFLRTEMLGYIIDPAINIHMHIDVETAIVQICIYIYIYNYKIIYQKKSSHYGVWEVLSCLSEYTVIPIV